MVVATFLDVVAAVVVTDVHHREPSCYFVVLFHAPFHGLDHSLTWATRVVDNNVHNHDYLFHNRSREGDLGVLFLLQAPALQN